MNPNISRRCSSASLFRRARLVPHQERLQDGGPKAGVASRVVEEPARELTHRRLPQHVRELAHRADRYPTVDSAEHVVEHAETLPVAVHACRPREHEDLPRKRPCRGWEPHDV